MEITFPPMAFHVNWRFNYIAINKIEDLRTFCGILKKNGLTFYVEKGFHSYNIFLKWNVVCHSDTTMTIK